jgi:hypothetical protein
MGMKIFAMALSFDCLSAEQIPDHRERDDQQHAHDREAPDASSATLGARTISPTNESGLLRRWHDRDNPSLWAAGSVFLDGPDHAEKS